MKFEKLSSKNFEISNDVKVQLENLGLTLDEIEGRILDVGCGEAEFATEINKLTKADVISVDDTRWDNSPNNVVISDVRKLPFKDGAFDKVISHASIPNVFIGMYSEDFPELSTEEIKKSIRNSFREIIRVLKSGSSAVMAPVRIADNYNSEKAFVHSLEEVINEIIKDGVDVSFELIREVENPVNKEKNQAYRLTLTKK